MSLPVYWQWNPMLNVEVRVIRVLSAVDPKTLGWEPQAWRAAVRWACDVWERCGVIAFVPIFDPTAPGTYPADTGILQVTAQDPDEVTPGKTWNGYMNPHIPVGDPQLVTSADVWIAKACPVGMWQYVLGHEFGHILGLDHRPQTVESCMTSPARKFPPDQLDLDAVREAYLGA